MRKLAWVTLAIILLWAGAYFGLCLGGRWAARRALVRLSQKTGIPLTVNRIDAKPGRVLLRDVRTRDFGSIASVRVDYDLVQLLLLRAVVDVSLRGADLRLGPDVLLHKSASTQTERSPSRLRIRKVTLAQTRLTYVDPKLGVSVATNLETTWRPSEPISATLTQVQAQLDAGPTASAERIELRRPKGAKWPRAELHRAFVRVFAGLELTNIIGWIGPRADNAGSLDLVLSGSYGGAAERLWDASGWIRPDTREADVRLRAEQFHLDKLASVLAKWPLANLEKAQVGADLTLRRLLQSEHPGAVEFSGSLEASGLTFANEGLAPTAVSNLGGEATVRGRFEFEERNLVLDEAVLRFGAVTTMIDGRAEHLGPAPLAPLIRARLRVPPVGCQAMLNSLPRALLLKLADFRLAGTFDADLSLTVDLAAVERLRADDLWKRDRKLLKSAVELTGHVGLQGCHVLSAPLELDHHRLLESFAQTAEVSPGHFASFVIGPENPDFVPLEAISPYLIGSILTTEDSRFYDHHGFIAPEIRSALARDLIQKRFAYGASSITMQMVKNVLLSHEKTLARKLQELFLTWYVENSLPKQRILEIYLNAIEFGPGIFGVGRAAQHFFGTTAQNLTPLQAAFFSSVLPAPKRRYEHYCRGKLSPRWEKYLPRILKRMHERGRLTDAEYEETLTQKLEFDRSEAKPEKECLDLLRKIVNASEEEPLDELELPFLESEEEFDEPTLPN